MLSDILKEYIRDNDPLMRDLQTVKDLNLPECYIAAGYIRNYIWDRLHGYGNRGNHQDIDVVYYDPHNLSEERDLELERSLVQSTGCVKWSVKNQARMHLRNGDSPYLSTAEALMKWPETATAVGARLDDIDGLVILSPYGLEDLFQMTVRRSPLFEDRNQYLNRIRGKNWKKLWPLLHVIEE
jgi:hypothetical protein